LTLNLDDAVRYAIESNLSLQRQRIDLASSGYSERNIWMEIFPTVNATAGVGYRSPLFSESIQNPGINYSIGFGLNLSLNAGIPYVMNNIKLAHQGNILKFEDARNQLSIQITKLFYARIAEFNNLALLEEILNVAQIRYARSETAFRNGLAGELSLVSSRMAVENARYNLSTARITYSNNMTEFLAMLGMDYGTNVALSGEIDIARIEADADSLIAAHLPGRPDIVRAAQEIERLENVQSQVLFQNRAPSVSLSLNWSSSNFDPFSDLLSANANLTIPVDSWIPGTTRGQNVTRARENIERARLDLTMTQNAARTQIRSLTALLSNSWDSILIARLALDAAQRTYQLTEERFLSGRTETTALEDAHNDLAAARRRLQTAELSYFYMILDLSAALNIDWRDFMRTFGITNTTEALRENR